MTQHGLCPWRRMLLLRKKEVSLLNSVDRAGLRFSRLLSGAYGPRRRARLESRLKRAGYPAGLTQRKFIQRETGFVVLGIIVLLFCFLIDELIIGVGLGLLLAFWMQVWLTNTGLRRSQQIDRDLPDFLDVLSVTVRSGMSFRPAVERVSSFHEGPLAEEMRGAIYSMRLGVTRRDASLRPEITLEVKMLPYSYPLFCRLRNLVLLWLSSRGHFVRDSPRTSAAGSACGS